MSDDEAWDAMRHSCRNVEDLETLAKVPEMALAVLRERIGYGMREHPQARRLLTRLFTLPVATRDTAEAIAGHDDHEVQRRAWALAGAIGGILGEPLPITHGEPLPEDER